MNAIQIVAEIAEVEVKEDQTVELSLADLDFVGGGNASLILA